LRVESAIRIVDVPQQFGRWLTSVQSHFLRKTPRFRLGIHPVTHLEFLEFVEDGGYNDPELWDTPGDSRWRFRCSDSWTLGPASWKSNGSIPDGLEAHPVTGVSYLEAKAFCRWLNRAYPQDGWEWTLPTEDMWEFAARLRRGSSPTRYPWGDTFEDDRCNSVHAGLGRTSAVGAFPKGNTPDGCADMAGNVWEAVLSNPLAERYAWRGGSFRNNRDEVQSSIRLVGVERDHRPDHFGFRCALVERGTPS
jgi:formylglycine-generating enzyme required for sulfatase activity